MSINGLSEYMVDDVCSICDYPSCSCYKGPVFVFEHEIKVLFAMGFPTEFEISMLISPHTVCTRHDSN